MRAAAKKRVAQKPPRREFGSHTFPAPIRGWVLNESLVAPGPAAARVLDNWICDLTTIRCRKGYAKHGTTGASVTRLITYKSGAQEDFFAATATAVYDMTSPADPEVAPAADISGQTSGDYSWQQFATPGGDYLYIVNGSDSAQLYDGTTWTQITGVSSPAITGVATSDLSHVWSHASRLFFVEQGTKVAWYLPVDSIGGGASSFSLQGVFKKGGALLFGATWSLDAGDGMDDKCVFVSTEGEVAVYSGTNPGSATDWALEGVYLIDRPLGRQTIRAGGDLLIPTEVGLVPLSEALKRDIAAMSLGAVSRAIEPYWQDRASALPLEWDIVKWPAENLLLVSQPETTSTGGACLVANLQSGAWSRFTGMDTRSLGIFAGNAYFGATDGAVYRMQTSGADNGAIYTCAYLGAFEPLGAPGLQKTVVQMRPTFSATSPIEPLLTVATNYSEALSPPPNATANDAVDGWDVSIWDSSLWDASSGTGVSPDESAWVSIGRTGYAIAPELQISFGSAAAPNVELIGIDATYSMGSLVA